MRYAFHNRLVNPVVSALLRSPLHGIMSRTNALVTCRGRRTGRALTLPLRYAQDDTGLWIHPARADRKTWWRNLQGGAPVTVRLRGRELTAYAEAIQGDPSARGEGHVGLLPALSHAREVDGPVVGPLVGGSRRRPRRHGADRARPRAADPAERRPAVPEPAGATA